ncbi:MAG: hypothetical protein ACRDP6_32990, partial [Actinoallomurus sp.]
MGRHSRYTTLEGPKPYERDGWYWIFAPAGGVTNGRQSAFRDGPAGPDGEYGGPGDRERQP